MAYINVTAENFSSEVLNSDIPVLVDFWAPWCKFCLMISPAVEDISEEMNGKIKVCKINCDDAQQLALSYGISSIPALMLFSNGEKKEMLVGMMSKSDIRAFIERNI